MLVFADRHHAGLFYSLKLLFEDRLGGTLYCPIGTDWLDKGFWRIAEIYLNHPATVAQYLGTDNATKVEDGLYTQYDPAHEFDINCVTLDKFFQLPIDIVLASVPEHVASFKRLANMHKNKPKFIFQVGNSWSLSEGSARNIMASALINNVPAGVNLVEYHQEFPLDIFRYEPPDKSNLIRSFVNCFNTAEIYKDDWFLFQQVEGLLADEYCFEALGGSCRDGHANGQKEVAQSMRDSKFIWHTKWGGDGYGHILYNSASVGRPLIVKTEYYKGKLGNELLIDGVTCVAIDALNPEAVVDKIKHYSELTTHLSLCINARRNFEGCVDFAEDADRVLEFTENLLYN